VILIERATGAPPNKLESIQTPNKLSLKLLREIVMMRIVFGLVSLLLLIISTAANGLSRNLGDDV
jgi:hypothetical protein